MEQAYSLKKSTQALLQTEFKETLSHDYGQNHLTPETAEAAREMAEEIRAVHIERMKKNDWMSDGTREKAIEKLEKMQILIGYQPEWSPIAKELQVDTKSNLVDALFHLHSQRKVFTWQQFDQSLDLSNFHSSSFFVNAYYSPTTNSIEIPAAILQAPFFSAKQSDGENYGGLGSVLGHEMTHGFDHQGANFNENGEYKPWWLVEDYNHFQQLLYPFIQQWDELTYLGEPVDGKLTLGENIADAGGLSVALEAYGSADKEFFEGYARAFRDKTRPAVVQYLLKTDPHAPEKLRVNQQLSNLNQFYEIYDVKEGDLMFITKEERISLW